MNRVLISLAFLLLLITSLSAQNRQIEGYVVNQQNGQGIQKAYITILPDGREVESDVNGSFSVLLSPDKDIKDQSLVIIAEGYKTVKFPLKGIDISKKINIPMKEDIFYLQEVVTTATRTPKALANVPTFTRVIRSKEIENMGAVGLINILESEMPGIEFKIHGNQTQVDMQGMGAGSVLFLVDGERVAAGEQSNIDYFRFPAQDIERIEIIKGAASALYGSNAVGGVVNIITKNAKKKSAFEINTQERSTGEYTYNMSYAARISEKFNTRSSATYQRIGGFDIPFRNEEIQSADTTMNLIFSQKIQYKPIEKLNIGFTGEFFDRKRFEGDPRLAAAFRGYRANATASYRLNDKTNFHTSYLYDYYSKHIYNKHYPSARRKDGDDAQQSIRIQANHSFSDNNTIALGGEFFREVFEKENQVKEPKTADIFSFFAQHDIEIFKNFSTVYGLRADKHSTFGVNLSPKVSLMYKWNNLTFRGSYSNSFTAPTIKQLYMDFYHAGGGIAIFKMIGNEDLKPQTSNNFNVSTEYTYHNVNASVMAFHNMFNNKIVEHRMKGPTGGVLIQWANSGRNSSVTGFETNFRVKLPYNFYLKSGYTYSYVYNPVKLPKVDKYANQTYTRPHIAIARLEYNYNKIKDWSFYASVWGKFASKLEYDEWNETEVYKIYSEGYAMLNAMARVQFLNRFAISIEGSNLTGYIPSSYTFNSPLVVGQSLMLGLQFNF